MATKPYLEIADRVAAEIALGSLPVGARLPPQRAFAFERGIAVSTASRVYEELRRRGLVTGEVGRGTFVASRFAPLDTALQEPASGLDLEIVFRLSEPARLCISESTARFFKSGLQEDAMRPATTRGTSTERQSFASLLSSPECVAQPEDILFAGNGKQAIAAALTALAPRGGRIGVEALTYPFVLSVARRLGIELRPLAMDDEGIAPSALEHAARGGLDAVYVQPTLQSPCVLTMSLARRKQLAEVIKRHELPTVEDRVYGFLRPTPPLASFAPGQVIQIDSLSKRMMPGSTVGILHAPPKFQGSLAKALRSGGWMAPPLAVALSDHWMRDGTLAFVEEMKRKEAQSMYDCAAEAFSDLAFQGAPEALHGWLELPNRWRADPFTEACAALGIAVAPGRVFAVGEGVSPSAVRIAFSAPDLTIWRSALETMAELARRGPA